ncbi:hypothetical protein H8E07_02950 [bacterium]|nr:hypothetical protein [bacterium]
MARGWYGFPRYVSAAERLMQAEQRLADLRRDGMDPRPVEVSGRKIAKSIWGHGWCRHLESFSDYENRLPRGRTYVRRGSVLHLDIAPGVVTALVSGTSLYTISIRIKPLGPGRWRRIRRACAGRIGSMLELLQGRFSDEVMAVVADRKQGLFPLPRDISLSCDCPDWAVMCKHVAAALYGVGARLDEEPELLFLMRDVDPEELITSGLVLPEPEAGVDDTLDEGDLAGLFGIELAEAPKSTSRRRRRTRVKKKESTPRPRRRAFRPTPRSIARLRADFGLSAADFADLIGVSVASVMRWEEATGTLKLRARSARMLVALADVGRDLVRMDDG